MQKFLLLMAAAMTAMSVSAQTLKVGNFTDQQVSKAMQMGQIQAGSRQAAAQDNVMLINETFDKWTAGSNDAPDATIVDAEDQAAVDALCDQPGWTAFLCAQAGGAVYQSFDEVGEDGPGYLMTPDFDMSQHQGVLRFKARVKNVNADATDAGLQYFILNNTEGSEGMYSAGSLAMTYGEYTEVEVVARATSAQTAIMFFSWKGKVLVDNVTVEDVIYALGTPENIQVEALSGTEVRVSCDPVEGATSYKFRACSRKEGVYYTATSAEPSAVITACFDAAEDVIVYVTACNGDDESYEGVGYGPISYKGEIETPVALDATNVTDQGFTANWEPSTWANTYQLTLNRTHTVGEEAETIYYMQEDFSEVTMSLDDVESTVMTSDGQVVSLDPYINAKGWNTYLASVSTGMLAITNMYEAYGFPGLLVSDTKDFSFGGGKVHVTGMGATLVDDVVLKVGFAEAQQTMFGTSYTFLDGAQEFELSTSGAMFDVEVEGGTESSILLIKMVDADPSGDMACFLTLNLSAEAAPGDQISGIFDVVTVPGTQTSYDVEVDFPETDSFTYNVVGKFGDNASAASDDITVLAPGTATKLDRVAAHQQINAIFTLDGRRVAAQSLSELPNGTYIVRGAKVTK